MRPIYSKLTPELDEAYGSNKSLAKSSPFHVSTFSELTKIIAKLAYLNKDYLLFYRGQTADYKNKSNASTFYPTIYREDYLQKHELEFKFEKLNTASKILTETLVNKGVDGHFDIKKRKLIQWSILQHYEVVETPLIDITQSLRVACSFAFLNNTSEYAYIYVFGLPYYNNRISHNSEHDLVNIRLLSIAPPDALRPYFQEGFLVGTDEITTEYDNKSDLDLNNRLLAKFVIPRTEAFWGPDFSAIPQSALYPENDYFRELCEIVKEKISETNYDASIGDFIKLWEDLEQLVMRDAKTLKLEVYNLMQALRVIKNSSPEKAGLVTEIELIRPFRNKLVHTPSKIEDNELQKQTQTLRQILNLYTEQHGR